ncbi:MAG: Gfo/Idh/MocA family oxidoreductase [Eubacteriales bacterium]|nr:Gfo/Idh/MocA family oxidoreductase [Eubacteriales bacterium]
MNIGILGTGSIASVMADTLAQMSTARCVAVASRSQEKAQQFAEKHGIARAYGSYEELLNDPRVELVYVATPHSHHYPHAKMALEHGKHVLCEKAFTVNQKQAQALFDLAEEKHLLITEAMWTRYLPMRGTINEVMRSGIVGAPRILTANHVVPICQVPRMKEPSLAGGALLDLGVYSLNFAAMIFGSDPLSVTGTAQLTDLGVDAQEAITMTYADGRMALLHNSMMALGDKRGIIECENGYLEVKNIVKPEELRVYNRDNVLIAAYKEPKNITGYEYEIEACIRALDANGIECPLMPHAETLRVMGWMDSLREQFDVRYPEEIEAL